MIIEDVTEINGEKLFVLKFTQGRNPEWVNKTFFARYDESASWLDDLRPGFGAETFFFKPELQRMYGG